MFVFALQFQQFLLETLPTNQIFDICVCIDHVVSVVSALRLQIFNMCVFFSMQFVVYLRENQIIPGVCSFLPCSFCSFQWETLPTIQIFDIRVHFHPVVSVVFAGRLSQQFRFLIYVFVFTLQFLQFCLGGVIISICVCFSLCSVQSESGRIKDFWGYVLFHPVVSVVSTGRLP